MSDTPGVTAAVIVKRSRSLTPADKLVWLEYWLLGRSAPGGWIGLSLTVIADRLAIHVTTVKRSAAGLEEVGLLEARTGSRRRASERRARFPLATPPLRIPDLDDQVRWQTALDSHIDGCRRVVAKCAHSEVAECDHSEVAKRTRALRKGGKYHGKGIGEPRPDIQPVSHPSGEKGVRAAVRGLADHMTPPPTGGKR